MSDITLGQFFPGNSFLHRLDPRTKILTAILYMAIVFCAKHPIVYLALLLFTASIAMLGQIKLALLWKSLKPLFWVLLLTGLLNVFFTKGESEPLLSFGIIEIYKEGISRAILMALRVMMLVAGASVLLTYTTSPIRLTDGIESLLSPLRKIRMPIHEFAMMMTIALRFIPTLIEETQMIMKAQKARGADFSSGGLIQRAKALLPILIPLFVASFQHAMDLATAMECRCYHGGEGRTKYHVLRYKAADILAMIGMVALLGAVLLGNHYLPEGWMI